MHNPTSRLTGPGSLSANCAAAAKPRSFEIWLPTRSPDSGSVAHRKLPAGAAGSRALNLSAGQKFILFAASDLRRASAKKRPNLSAQDLGQQLLDHMAVDVGQPVVPALEPVDQAGVVKAQQVQDRGLQVVDVDLVLGHGKAQLVGLAVAAAAARAAAGQPHREAVGVVVATQ